jgi:hypothetical protein
LEIVVHLIKRLVVIGFAAILLFSFMVAFSSVETRYQCSGSLATKNGSLPATIYLKVASYRWWVHLWSSSDGAIWLEIPHKAADYYGQITKVGDQLQISRSSKELAGLWGYLSTLSGALALETADGNFNGRCEGIDAR